MTFPSSTVLHITAVAALGLVLSASGAQASDLKVSGAWMRALPSGLPAGGYFTLHNGGGKDMTLTGANSAACGMLMLHKSDNMGGMMHMEDVAKVDLPANGTIKFAPGGYHLMCMEPSADVKPGRSVKVTLTFSDGSAVTAPFAVKSASGT